MIQHICFLISFITLYLKEITFNFLRAFDVLEKAINITNEVFIGAPGIVNDMGIRKPSYYAYYLIK